MENRYADPRMWGELHQEFKFGAIGTGVTIGDYDGDGRPDIFVVSKTEASRLFRNLGDWRFEDVTAPAGLLPKTGLWQQGVDWARRALGGESESAAQPWSQGATFADIDNDGDLDLYVCRFAAPNQLWVNQGDGTFQEEADARGLAVIDASSMAAFCDYDRDGWLDVFVQTNLLNVSRQPTGQRDYLFRNRGDGTFVDVTDQAGIRGLTQGHSATWWDFNEDGWPDLYGAHDFAPPDTLYRNNGDGTFTDVLTEVIPYTPHSSMGADLGDLNNDGHVDLLVADMAATTSQKDQRGMAKIRSLLRDTAASEAEATPQLMRNALYLGTGYARVREAAQLAGLEATDWTWSVLCEDFDNDGRLDVHITNGMVRELHNADLVQRMSGAESVAESNRILHGSPALNESNLAFRNHGELAFENVSAAWGLDQRGVSFGAAAADLDGDGDLDLIFSNYEKPPTVLRNDGTEGGRLIVALRGTRSNRFGVGATVRVETANGALARPLVLARGYLSSSEPALHFGLGSATRVSRLTVTWPSGQVQEIHDLPANHRIIVTEPETATVAHPAASATVQPLYLELEPTRFPAVHVENPWFDEVAREPLLPFRQNRRGPALAVGDLDGDEQPEIVMGGTPAVAAQILRSSPTGWAVTGSLPAQPSRALDGPVLIFDANGDGANDLLVTRSGNRAAAGDASYQPQLWLNTGRGNLAPAAAGTLPVLPTNVAAAAVADFDRDGRLDVLLAGGSRPGAYPQPEATVLLQGTPTGGFEDVTAIAPELGAIGRIQSVLWTDLDNDGWLDLLLAPEWDTIRAFRNDAGQGFSDASTTLGFAAAGQGLWTSLAAGDLNGDGRLDYFAGNIGLNTPYAASMTQPLVLLRGDWTGNGVRQLLETRWDGDRLMPRRSRSDLAAALPALARRLPRHDLFARASIEDLFSAERVAAAERYTATELRSGVFLSQPTDDFQFSPLPRLAQIAPAQGALFHDVNGDGHADLLLAQNSHAPIAQTGRFAGGLGQILLGDSRGGFVVLSPQESGWLVPGDGEALVRLDVNGDNWPDVLVSRHDSTALAFEHQPPAGATPLRVTLVGKAPNRAAIGARVTVVADETHRQIAEIGAGGGWLSQSAPEAVFAFPKSHPPREVEVRWPNGRTSRHRVPGEARELQIDEP